MIYNAKTGEQQELVPEETPDTYGYGEWAESVNPDSKKSYCKKEQFSDFARYYVKMASNGTLYDPWGSEANVKVAEYGTFKFEYKKVKPEVFEFYFRFLETKNATHLIRAQRLYNEAQ